MYKLKKNGYERTEIDPLWAIIKLDPFKHILKLIYQSIVNLYIVVKTKNHQIFLNTLTMKMDKAFLI